MDGKENWDEMKNLIYNDTLHIYPRDGGFKNLKTNKCLDKLQFLVSLICTNVTSTYGAKRVKQFRTRLKNIVKVSNVYIGHIDEYYKALRERRGKFFENNYEFSKFIRDNFKLQTVLDYKESLESEIFESSETLRSFILSPNSWIYSDDTSNYSFRSEMYCGIPEKDYDSIATVDYGNSNKVNVGIKLFDDPMSTTSFKYSIINKCRYIELNENTGKLIIKKEIPNNTLVKVCIIGDTYNLIFLELEEIRKDINSEGVFDICSGEYQRFKENTISIFNEEELLKNTNIKSYKACPVVIQSQKILGDIVI